VTDWRRARAVWVIATLVAVPASAMLWFAGGYAFCGEEVYDTPPGSAGDTLCRALVEPIVPWALLASVPFFATFLGGFVGIRLRSRRLFVVALSAPFLVVVFALFATTAVF
jgi:hypothetical protein